MSLRHARRLTAALAAIVLVTGAFVGGAAELMVAHRDRTTADQAMNRRVAAVQLAVVQQMQRYEDSLSLVAAAAGTLDPLTPARFQVVTAPLGRMSLPGTTAIVFVNAPVAGRQVPALQALWRARGQTGLVLHPDAAQAEHLFPVMSRSLDGQQRKSAGLDLNAEPTLSAALTESLRRGAPTISDPYHLLIDRRLPVAQQQLSFSLMTPVWSASTTPGTPPTFRGWVLLGIRGQNFIRDALTRAAEGAVDVTLLAAGQPGAPQRVAALRAGYSQARTTHRTVTVPIAQSQWRLQLDAAPQHLINHPVPDWLVIAVSALLAGLLALLVVVLASGRSRAKAQVTAAIRQLRAANAELESARTELLERQEFSDALLDTMDVGVLACDATGTVTFANRPARVLLGFEPESEAPPAEQMAGLVEVFAADGVSPVPPDQRPMARALTDGAFTGIELVVAPPLMPRRHLMLNGRALRDSAGAGAVTGAVVAAHDITELVRDRAALQRSEGQYRASFENAVAGKTHTAVDGRLLQANRALADMLGYSREQLLTMSWQDFTHPEDRDISAQFIADALAGGVTGGSFDKRYLHRDGHVVHVRLNIGLIRDPDGTPLHFSTQMIDITARVHAEEALRDQRNLYSQLLQAMSDLGEGVTISAGGRFTYANEAYCALQGRDLAQLQTITNSMELCPEEEIPAWQEFMAARAAGEVIAPLQTAVRHSDGSRVPVEVATLAVPTASGPVYVSITRNLSEQIRIRTELAVLVRELETRNEELRVVNQFKDDIVAMLSHDLRQPVTAAIGFCEVTLDDWEELSEDTRRQFVARAARAGHWANDLLEDVLTMASLDAEKPVPSTSRVNLAAAVTEGVTRWGADALHARVEVPAELDVLVDPGHFQQILGNLVGNALEYGRPPLSIVGRRVADTISVEVADSGDGVPAEFVDSLFERFTRADSAKKSGRKGSGLGLYIAHTLAAANSATLRYEPADSTGARFVLTLQAADSAEITASVVAQRQSPEASSATCAGH